MTRNNTQRLDSGRNRKPKKKVFTSKMQASLLLVFCVIMIALIGLAVRVAVVNAENSDRYRRKVYSQQTYVSNAIPFRRGDILDRNGTVLATSVRIYKLVIDPKKILSDEQYVEPVTQALVSCFGLEEEDIQKVLAEKPDSQYQILSKNVSEEQKAAYEAMVEDEKQWLKEKKIEELRLTGVYFEEAYNRIYPQKDLACDVIGFTYEENKGNWGLEQYYNDELNGTNGRSYGYYDAELNLQRTVKNPVDGNTIVSTIDANVQSIVQDAITNFQEKTGAKNVGCIVMNPNNGEVYAMASGDFYDLNNPRDLTPFYSKSKLKKMTDEDKLEAMSELWRNFCISDSYEPGSTFKPMVVAAGLEEGTLTGNETFTCKGYHKVANYTIGCAKKTGHGTITLAESIAYSCNVALMQIGERIGRANFYEYMTRFNMGRRTGIDLPGEGVGVTFTEKQLNSAELATSSFGQGFTTTMIQMASALSSVVNGGSYYEPHMVREIRNAAGAVVKSIDPVVVKETVSSETSKKIREYMTLAVSSGTAVKAQIDGFSIAGKTGTAEKQPRDKKKYLVSFVGTSPADHPEVLFYVIVDEPKVEKQADSSYAIQLCRTIMKKALPFLGVYSSKEEPKKTDKADTTKKEDTAPKNDVVNKPGTGELDYDNTNLDDVGVGVSDQPEGDVPWVDQNQEDPSE